jgi:short-subunit dehydrogenase
MSKQSPPWKHVWITGASSGLGEYTARLMAELGCTVSITARRQDRLHDIARENANIFAYPADVTDAVSLKAVVAEIEARHGPVDLALFSSGAWFPGTITNLNLENFSRTMDINVMGVVNALDAVLPSMVARGAGHVSWVASVSGYVGLPLAASYGASKAALLHIAESAHGELHQKGVTVSVINPGFVRTQLTDQNRFRMPFLMRPEDAARKMVEGLQRKKFEIAFPWQMVWLLKILRLLPYSLSLALVRRLR